MNKKVVVGIRILFGIVLIAIGVMAFLNMPLPEGYPQKALDFLQALGNTGYMLYVVGIVEIAAGLMFVLNRYSALGAVLIAPISVNILLFHIFLDLKTIVPGLVFMALNIFVAYTERKKYQDLLKVR